MAKYRPERFWPRLVPQSAITVSIYDRELGHAYGVITNLSAGGACIDSAVHFAPGTGVLLRIRVRSEGDLFVTEAEIVWSREKANSNNPQSFLLGAKFSFTSEEQRSILKRALVGLASPAVA